MKVIIATPRTGSTFYSRYLQFKDPLLECVDECFQDYHYPKEKNAFDITTERLTNLKDNYIIKILAGQEVDFRVWNFLEKNKIPVTIIKRKNKRRQFISFGISCLNNIWVRYKNRAVGLNTSFTVEENLVYKKGIYKKEWFDNLNFRLKQLEFLENFLFVDKVLYYEDIINLEIKNTFTKKEIPIKQNLLSDNELINFFTNKVELDQWINSVK